MNVPLEVDLRRLNENPYFTILIIDDMESIRRQLIDDLRDLNFKRKIVEAETLIDALVLLESKIFDLVICDRNLPEGSGMDFLFALRKNHRLSKVPILMCTTVNEAKSVVEAIKQGANEYIIKPWSKEQLARKILAVIPPLK